MFLLVLHLMVLFLHGVMGEHLMVGFPSCPLGHEHIGRCLIGLH